MAKRKRLSPANPVFLGEDTSDIPAPRTAPIADVAGEASALAALQEVTDTLARARDQGRMVISLPLEQVEMGYLVRDRIPVDDEEMVALLESLRARGQQAPIEVAPLGPDRYGLISGWRRCSALIRLQAETGGARFGSVLALVRQPDQSSEAYLAMVEENEIRVGLSFYERARIVARTVENRVYPNESAALRALFAAASRAKRSKIKSFVAIVRALDGVLYFPQSMGERTGLKLAKALEETPEIAARLRDAFVRVPPQTAEEEKARILAVLGQAKKSLTSISETNTARQIAPGLTVKSGLGNSLILKGPALSKDLRDRLIAWLKAEI